MRILKGDIIAASGEFIGGSGLERGRPFSANGQTNAVTADVAGSPVNLATSITYLPFGPQTGMTYGSSLTFSATYDQNYWPLSRAVSSLYSHAYTTDDAGNITGIDSTDYGYDALNRLDEEDSGSATTYTYDATSNRLTKINGGTVTTTVPSGSNKISAVGSDSYTYDASGNITDDGVREYVWDSTGRLEEVKISSSTVGAYTYNAYNQRTKKVAGTTTHYVYGAGGLLYGEYDNSGDLIREYIYLNGEPLAQINAGSPETLTYLHPDHLGTPKFGTNAGGTQVWSWTPDAFGNGAPSGSVTVNLRMPGQYFDAESGLFYNWNRYYNPAIGRYISSDPIGLEGGINTFLYAGASPVMMIDPTGELFFAPVLAWFGGAAASLPSAAAIGVAIADGFAKATAGIILMSSLTGDTATDNAAQQAERKAYNRVCIEPIPPTGDPCTDAKNKLNRQKQCLQMREDYGRKWYNDSDHEGHNEQIRRSIKNLEDWIRDNCKEGCNGQQ